jgi:hypothetical protein
MLNWLRTFLGWCIVALVVSVVAWGATFSPSYQKCVTYNGNNEGKSEQTNLNNAVMHRARIAIPIFLLCEGRFVDENNGTLTALATIAIAGFTLTLWRATTEQGQLTRNALELARNEFNASHRPKVIVHATEAAYGTNKQGMPTIGIDLHCINIGNTEAVIDELIGEIGIFEASLRANILLPTIEIVPIKIGVGEKRLIHINSTFDDKALNRATNVGAQVRGPIFCLAAFSYRDGRGIPRQTGICRVFSSNTGENRWYKYDRPGHEAYEYSY